MTQSTPPSVETEHTAGHTPTPWKWCGCGKCGYITTEKMDREICVALMAPVTAEPDSVEHPYWCSEGVPSEERRANAEFIVQAVNSHASLSRQVEELRKALEFYAKRSNYDHGYGLGSRVTNDDGAIARFALATPHKQESGE